jgi:hypothetical protein
MIVPIRWRQLSRFDKILIGILAALTVTTAVWSEQEDRAYDRWRNSPLAKRSNQPESRRPAWVREWKRLAWWRLHAARSGLVTASLGLALVAFRPGRIARPRRRGPGYVAVAITGTLSAVSVFHFIDGQWVEPLLTDQAPFYESAEPPLAWSYITDWARSVPWAIVPAWIYLALTGHWRRPLDPLDRLGRWLGWAWVGVIAANWMVELIPSA